MHHDEAVAQANRVVHVVRDHERREPSLGDDLLGEVEDLLGRLGVKGGRVLVKQQQLGVGERGHEQRERLALAAGEQADLGRHARLQAQAQRGEQLGVLLLLLGGDAPGKTALLAAALGQREVLGNLHVCGGAAHRVLEHAAQELGALWLGPVEMKNGAKKTVQKKMFPGYVLINMVMNDDTWYVVRNTRGVTGFVGPGSKPVPLTEAEMKPLGIKTENVSIDFAEGDTIVVVAGAWKDTVGLVQRIDYGKQTATINVELFGRETPVEISFAEVRKLQ